MLRGRRRRRRGKERPAPLPVFIYFFTALSIKQQRGRRMARGDKGGRCRRAAEEQQVWLRVTVAWRLWPPRFSLKVFAKPKSVFALASSATHTHTRPFKHLHIFFFPPVRVIYLFVHQVFLMVAAAVIYQETPHG